MQTVLSRTTSYFKCRMINIFSIDLADMLYLFFKDIEEEEEEETDEEEEETDEEESEEDDEESYDEEDESVIVEGDEGIDEERQSGDGEVLNHSFFQIFPLFQL